MKANEQEKRKQLIAGGLGILALILVSYQMYNLFGGSSTPVPAPAPVITTAGTPKPAAATPAAAKVGVSSTQLDPTLHEEAMLVTEGLVYSGSGRNIFSGTVEAAPPPVTNIPKPVTGPRQVAVVAPAVPTGPPLPPPPPPINLKFFGTDTAQNGTRRAFLLNGDDVFLASVGDVVQRKYRVVSIAANSILVEDIPNSNKQTLPLTGN